MGLVNAAIRRGDVYLVQLNPTRGREIRKTRPCVVVSPDELNAHLETFIVAPLTTGSHQYPFRVPCRFAGKDGHLVLPDRPGWGTEPNEAGLAAHPPKNNSGLLNYGSQKK